MPDDLVLPSINPRAGDSRRRAKDAAKAVEAEVSPQVKRATTVSEQVTSAFAGIDDPMVREIAKGTIEATLSDALGFRFKIPDEDDLALKALRDQESMQQISIDVSKNNVLIARKALADLPPEARKELNLTGPPEDLFESDPDLALSLANAMEIPVTRGDLLVAGAEHISTEAAQEAQALEDREAAQKEIKGAVSTGEAIEKLPDTKEHALGIFKGLREQSEQATGLDLTPGSFPLDDVHLDTAAGGSEWYRVLSQSLPGASALFGNKVAVPAIMEHNASELQDQLEEAPTTEDKRIIVGQDVGGLNGEAAFWLTAGVMEMAGTQGVPLAAAFKQAGLDIAGIDMDSFTAELDRIAKGRGFDAKTFVNEGMGEGFQRAFRAEYLSQKAAIEASGE